MLSWELRQHPSPTILTRGAGKARRVVGRREGRGGSVRPGGLLWGGGAARAEPEGHWVLPLGGRAARAEA